jgi:Amt family ammonium transporter
MVGSIAVLAADTVELNTGNTAWILTSATLVLLMTVPALAFFYGGMVRTKSVLNMMMFSFGAAGIVGVIWVLWGYSMSFGTDIGGIIGQPFEYFALHGVEGNNASGVPNIVFVGFQATFAVITVALISGALADRVRFGPWLIFTGVWATLVYFPLCHWVWGGGFLGADGWIGTTFAPPIDFAGGTVVHINAGSAGAADELAGKAWVNTFVATAAASMFWCLAERIRDGKATSLGAASGVVAGLVAITPAAANVSPIGAIIVGAAAGILCALAVSLKYKWGYDDSLDVVGVHLVGGLTGTILIGFLSEDTGLFYGHNANQLISQILAALIAVVFSGVMTAIIGFAIKATIGWRVAEPEEISGIDLVIHGETAYETVGAAGRVTER